MGQREGFSPMDIEKVNRMYNCKSNPKPQQPPIKLPERVVPSRFPFSQGFATFFGNIFKGFNRFGSLKVI